MDARKNIGSVLGLSLCIAILFVALSWLVSWAVDRHVEMAEAKGGNRQPRAMEVKQRMRHHGTNSAYLGKNNTWYFKDKKGRPCRL